MAAPAVKLLKAAAGSGLLLLSPTDVGCDAWWDGNDPEADGTPPADNATPTTWQDRSGNGRHLTTRSGTPTYKTNQLGGRGVMRFDGVDDGYGRGNYLYTFSNPEIWFIARSNESGNGFICCDVTSSGGTPRYGIVDDDTNNDYLFQLINSSGTTRISNTQDRSTNAFDLVIVTDYGAATGTNVEVVDVDAGTSAAYTRDSISFDRFSVGFKNDNIPDTFFDGDIAELIVFSSHVSGTNRVGLTNYLNAKWGQSWTPV